MHSSIETKLKQLAIEIDKAHNILVVTHAKPDNDAIGTMCAMIDYLKSLHKKHTAFCPDPVPENLRFLPWVEEIRSEYDREIDQYDTILFLDISEWRRMREMTQLVDVYPEGKRPNILVVDHHINNNPEGNVCIIEQEYSSAAEITFTFFKTIRHPIKKNTAAALLIGILGDTENFTNAATHEQVLKIASELIQYGANFDKLSRQTWQSREFGHLKLMGQALERLTHNKEYDILVTVIKKEDTQKYDIKGSLEGLSNFLKGVSHGKAVVVLREDDGYIRGSLRSIASEVDVARLAGLFGGGGHRLAAGFSLQGKIIQQHGQWHVE